MHHLRSLILTSYWPEWTTVEGRGQGHYRVNDRKQAKEEHEEQQAHVEVVWPRCLENSLVRNVTGHHCPALEVHRCQETQHVQTHQTWSVKCSHPKKNNILSNTVQKEKKITMQFQTNQPMNIVISVIRDFVIAALMIGSINDRNMSYVSAEGSLLMSHSSH